MIVRVQVSRTAINRLTKLQRALGIEEAGSVLSRVPTEDLRKEVLNYLKSITPTGSRTKYWAARGATPPASEQPLKDSWRILRERTSATTISFVISSTLERSTRGKAKVFSAEFGHAAFSYTAKRTFTFWSNELSRFTTIKQGTVVNRTRQEGLHLTSKAADFIEERVVPEVKRRLTAFAERTLA